jgi:hypothetical protein
VTAVVYIIDASSLLQIRSICEGDEARTSAVFDAMFELARIDQLGFPACVPAGCRAYDESNFAASWSTPTHTTLSVRSVAYSFQQDVLEASPGLLDADSSEEDQPQVELVAYALKFLNDGAQATIVTEDVHPLPFREDVATAAGRLGIAVQTMLEFMNDRGL